MNKLIRHLFIGSLLLASLCGSAQTSTYSPYSYYGIGELVNSDYGLYSGMGGIGYGIKSGQYINWMNPASYSGIDSLRFLFDLGANGYTSTLKSASESYAVVNGNLRKLTFGFRMQPRWAVSFGLVPYSNMGYRVNSKKQVEGTAGEYINITCNGDGGLSRVYFGNSFKLSQRVSVGINSSLLVGSISKTESYTVDNIDGSWEMTRQFKPRSTFYFDAGIQYSDSINTKWGYTFGFIGGNSTTIRIAEYVTTDADSVAQFSKSYNFTIPSYLGVGLSISSNRWLFAADYRVQHWSRAESLNNSYRLTNSHHFAVGAQYTPDYPRRETLFKRMSYQVGAHYDRSYLQFGSNNIDILGVTAGVVIPMRNQRSSVAISVEAGRKGLVSRGLFRENYLQMNLSVCLGDIWFLKRRFE
jgi:hypothetical protein